jgi:penicillin-binding protein 2
MIGYVGEVSENMLNQPQWDLYNPGDVVGRSGVELQYNSLLMGENGSRQVVVNSHGKEVGELDEKPAVAGKPIKLTIDVDLQIAAEEAMQGWNGALVAMNPRNGEILAMVSRPTFDPNDFAQTISRKEWAALVDNENHPLMNKAIQAQLAPGSTFKIIMSVAGLQEHVAQDMHVFCDGGADFYGHYYHCHAKHGMVDITKGIYQSCDTFFYTLAEKLGIERIAKYATMFGLGQKTGIDLPQEVSGVMPSEEWKIRNFKEKWFAGETISVGIGQGSVAVSPVQLARALGGIASGGVLVRPHVAFPDGLPPNMLPASIDEARVPIDPKNWELITDAMAEVTNVGGTAAASHLEGIDFAGKTGTAQTISAAAKAKVQGSKARFKNNAWFVGVEPRRNPEIVICALLEQGDEGPVAARVVSKVIKAYVEKQRRQPQNVAGNRGKAEIGAVWTGRDEDGREKLQGGHFYLDIDHKKAPLATAAPGLN